MITKAPWKFLLVFLVVYFLSSVFLHIIDFVPEPKDEAGNTGQHTVPAEVVAEEEVVMREVPLRITIPSVGVDSSIVNPLENDIETLDAALLEGVVRYPGSSLLGEQGTVFLFGHQSYLPAVRNPAFKAFNDLQELASGDEIRVESASRVYYYRVTKVEKVRAEDALIPLTQGEKTLVLSTCNSFGDPGERYVVTAQFVSFEHHSRAL